MKTYRYHRVLAASRIVFLFLLFFGSAAWGAGAPATPSEGSDARKTANTHFQKGLKHKQAQQWAESAAAFEKAVQADPNYAEAYSNLGYAYRKQGMFDKAVSNYQKAISLDDHLAAAYEYLGEAYVEMGKMDLANQQLDRLKALGAGEEAADLEAFISGKKTQ